MSGINQTIEATPNLRRDYEARQAAVEEYFAAQPRGARTRCAFDIEVSPATISQVVSGNRTSLATLSLIEEWIAARQPKRKRREVAHAADRT